MDPHKYNINDLNDIDEIFDININDYINKYSVGDTFSSDESRCLKCNGINFIDDYNQGHVVCADCGLIGDDILDSNPEWKTYDDSNSTVGRCGKIVNQLLPRSSTGTRVEAYGRIAILQRWDSMPYKERSLNIVFKKLDEICKNNNIPKKIYDDSCIMYKIVSERKHKSGKNKAKYIITRGINRNSIIAASLFYACRRNNIPRSPKEVASMFDLNETDLNKGAKNFLKLIKMNFYDKNMGTSKPIDFVRRKCDDLNIKSVYTAQAINISENIDKLNIASTHTSCSLAAASILLMAEINNLTSISKPKLAEVFGLSDVTIGKAYKKVREFKNLLVNDNKVNTVLDKINNDDKKHTISKDLYTRMKQFNVNTDIYKIDEYDKYKHGKNNEIIIAEDSPDISDENESNNYNIYSTILKKCTIESANYIELIENIENAINNNINDKKVISMRKDILGT